MRALHLEGAWEWGAAMVGDENVEIYIGSFKAIYICKYYYDVLTLFKKSYASLINIFFCLL